VLFAERNKYYFISGGPTLWLPRRAGQHAIWINDQYRLCFRWDGHDAHEVEITDYH